jgi:urease subunit alpha
VRGCRTIGKAQMVRNDATPEIRVDPETYQVTVDGKPATVAAADEVAMSQLYYIV